MRAERVSAMIVREDFFVRVVEEEAPDLVGADVDIQLLTSASIVMRYMPCHVDPPPPRPQKYLVSRIADAE